MCQNNIMRFISKEKMRRNCISSLRAIDFIAPLSFFVHLRLYLHPQICLCGLRQGAIYLHLQHFLSFSTFCWCNKSSVVSGDLCLWHVCPQFALENRLRSSTINFPERGPVFVTLKKNTDCGRNEIGWEWIRVPLLSAVDEQRRRMLSDLSMKP